MSGSNETVISSRIPSTKESIFRRPLIPQTYHKMGAPEAFKTQLDVRELFLGLSEMEKRDTLFNFYTNFRNTSRVSLEEVES